MNEELTALAEQISKCAYKNEPPEHADFDDMRLFQALKALYRDFKEHSVKEDEAKAQKLLLISTFMQAKKERIQWRKDIHELNERIMISQKCGVNLHKVESLAQFAEDAAKMIEALTGDVGLVKKAHELQGGDPFD